MHHLMRFYAFQTKVCLNFGLKRTETRHMMHINLGLPTNFFCTFGMIGSVFIVIRMILKQSTKKVKHKNPDLISVLMYWSIY